MAKPNIRKMMLLRDHDQHPKKDRFDDEKERREQELERRIRKLEERERPDYWESQERNRYIDPMEYPRYPDLENYRKGVPYRGMPRIGFSTTGEWDEGRMFEHGGVKSKTVKMPRAHLTHDEAEEWTNAMRNTDGTRGPHWTLEQTDQVAQQRGISCDKNDFWAVMNMMYSDYYKVASKHSVDTPGFYADMAKAFLEDADAADGKAYLYRDCIADK